MFFSPQRFDTAKTHIRHAYHAAVTVGDGRAIIGRNVGLSKNTVMDIVKREVV